MRTIRWLLLALLIVAIPAASLAQFAVSVAFAPPALPVYTQPMVPAAGYLWTPGYWAYGDEGYFWVPGTWVMPPAVGLLWTPGYWGPQVGFYGGVNYGFGYGGVGYQGGYWNNGAFNYNRSVNNVDVTNIHNVYNKTVINNTTVNNVSYNGGAGGTTARPTQAEETAAHEQHRPPTAQQAQHVQAASTNHALLASVSQGRPAIAATAKPAEFSGSGVVEARQAGAPYKAPENRAAAPATASKAVPTPASAAHAQPAPRPVPAAHVQPAARPVPAAHAQPAARPVPAAHAQFAPRPVPVAHAQPAPRPAPAAHAQPAPRPELLYWCGPLVGSRQVRGSDRAPRTASVP